MIQSLSHEFVLNVIIPNINVIFIDKSPCLGMRTTYYILHKLSYKCQFQLFCDERRLCRVPRVLLLLHHAVLSGERALIHARSSSLHYSKTSSRRRQTQGESSEPNNTNCTCYTCVSYYIWHDLQGKKNSSRRIKVVFRLNFNQLNSFFKRRLPLKNCSYILTY